MTTQNVVNAVNTLVAQATAMTNAFSVPLSTLQGYASQAAASAAAAAASAAAAGNGGSGGNGGTPSGVNAMLLKIKAAMASSPDTYAAIPRTTTPVVTASTDAYVPAVFGSNYTRHWLAGAEGSKGQADLASVTTRLTAANIGPVLDGNVYFNTPDGSNKTQWQNQYANLGDYAGDYSGCFYGFTYTGRRFAFNRQSYSYASIMVDGNLVTNGRIAGPEGYVVVDLGSTGTRNIVVRGNPDFWHSEFIAENGATLTPYDPLTGGKLKVAIAGDSFMFGDSYTANGLNFPEALSMLIGGGHYGASVFGGTGFSSNNGDTNLRNASHPDRVGALNSHTPDIIIGACSINDGWPSSVVKTLAPDGVTVVETTVDTVQAMQTWLTGIRSANPNSLIVMVAPWAPKQSYSVAASYMARRDAMATLLDDDAGPWILVDGLSGRWSTHLGTNSGSGTGPWVTGEGNTAAPTGTGNADTWIGDDGTHPTSTGIIGYTGFITSYIRAGVASMATT